MTLWTGDDEWVRIEPQDDGATAPNDQPLSLDSTAVARALSALRIRIVDPDTGTEIQHTAFTADEVGRITPYVVSGLAKAGPRQDVTFSTIGSHSRGAGSSIKDPTVNAGRIFYQGGKLNVIFGELQSNYRKKNVYGQRDRISPLAARVHARRPASRKLALTAVPGVTFQSAAGDVRNDWLTIDLAVAGAQAVATSPPRIRYGRALAGPSGTATDTTCNHRSCTSRAGHERSACTGTSAAPAHRQPTARLPKSSAACGR